MTDDDVRPDATCTRGQGVTFLYRALKGSAGGGSASFIDVTANAFYADAVGWAVASNVTDGTSNTTFSSGRRDCTARQIVTFLYRAYQGKVKSKYSTYKAGTRFRVPALQQEVTAQRLAATGSKMFVPSAPAADISAGKIY